MSEHMIVFPPASVDLLRDQLTQYPGCQLAVKKIDGTDYLQVLPANTGVTTVGGAAIKTASAVDDPPPINDSFVCPGDPRCPK